MQTNKQRPLFIIFFKITLVKPKLTIATNNFDSRKNEITHGDQYQPRMLNFFPPTLDQRCHLALVNSAPITNFPLTDLAINSSLGVAAIEDLSAYLRRRARKNSLLCPRT